MADYLIRHLPANPELTGLARRIPDVVFSTAAGTPLSMQIFVPWQGAEHPGEYRYPLIVFLQGSGWTSPDVNYEIPQLCEYARMGYVVATITHRSYEDGHAVPAFLKDAKAAVRFLRAHAERYSIDSERVCFFGTSSGGNTSLLMALTGDDPRYRTEEYSGFSDAVQAAVECFGPTDLEPLFRRRQESGGIDLAKITGLRDEAAQVALLRELSPCCILKDGLPCPPVLLLHGSADELVPYEQGETMYRAMVDAGLDAEMICIDGAPHENTFWSPALHREIQDFLSRKL